MVKAEKWRYGIVLDAGSSGTRAHVYRWLRNEKARQEPSSLRLLPEIESKHTEKVHIGLSTYGPTPELIGTEHLKPLLDDVLRHVPESLVSETPVFLLGTAGLRLLPDVQRDEVLRNVCSFIQSETEFLLPDCKVHVQVISGEVEGLYGWVAANYLLGGFDAPADHNHGKGHHTYGFLDMGGASAQIAFAPNATEAEKHANDLKLLRLRTIGGTLQEYRVFVTSWLGFGVNEAHRKYIENLEETYSIDGLQEMPDPCLPAGLKMYMEAAVMEDVNPHQRYFLGTGNFDECLRRTMPLLQKDAPCYNEPCLINGVHVPAIDFDVNHFIGISQYWHTTHEIFEMGHDDKAYDFNTYQSRVKDFCEQQWTAIEQGIEDEVWGKKINEETVSGVCFRASWLINMLHDGIGIPRVGIEKTSSSLNGTKEIIEAGKEKGYLDPFQAVDEIKSTEVSWTLGKIVLYASADVPAPEGALPVGFGSNEPGIPADFHYPGGGRLQNISPKLSDSQSLTDQIHDTLFKSDAPHRLPGFIFFLLIMVIAIFYLCGRDRRKRYCSPFTSSNARNRKQPSPYSPISLLNRLLGRRSTVNYDHVLDDGNERLYDPDDFELGDMDSDESEGTLKNEDGRNSPRRSFKHVPEMLTPPTMDRRGVVVRTESRERMDLANGRSKSRNASPTRLKNSSTLDY